MRGKLEAACGVVHDRVAVFPKEPKEVPWCEIVSLALTGAVGEVVKVGDSEAVSDVAQSHPPFGRGLDFDLLFNFVASEGGVVLEFFEEESVHFIC